MALNNSDLLKKPLYVYDLPSGILDTIHLKTGPDDIDAPENCPSQKVDTHDEHTKTETQSNRGIACSLCNLSFNSVEEQRHHVRSDLHNYNLKQKMRGGKIANETEFEKLMGDLSESLSGSDSTGSDDDSSDSEGQASSLNTSSGKLSTLLSKQANIAGSSARGTTSQRKMRGHSEAPLLWFQSSALPSNTRLGVWRSILTQSEQESISQNNAAEILRMKQLTSKPKPLPPTDIDDSDQGGGVSLPQPPSATPHIFLCMIGGGHFAAMLVSLVPKVSKSGQGAGERQASVIAHKTFHRYTTRRKQGGGQAANDASGRVAHSAGSSLRRYNEQALTQEVRELLHDWKGLIDSSELLFVRATGKESKRTLFGPYEGQVLRQNDERLRGFPFSTRRATQKELMRCFVELTRIKIRIIDEEAIERQRQEAQAQRQRDEQAVQDKQRRKEEEERKAKEGPTEDEIAAMHTSQLTALIRRQKAPALLSYLSSNDLPSDFRLQPLSLHHHAPTPLHLAASTNSPAVVSALLVRARCDPTIQTTEGKTAFDVAGDRATRDAFRLARTELGDELEFSWEHDAHVPDALTKAEVDARTQRERREAEQEEQQRREKEKERLDEEERQREEKARQRGDTRRERKMGKGRPLTAEEKREEETKGLSEEAKKRLERERRVRAIEARLGKMGGDGGGG